MPALRLTARQPATEQSAVPGGTPVGICPRRGFIFGGALVANPEMEGFADRHKAWLAVETKTWEKTNDQVDRRCCLCLSRRNTGTGHVARAASSTRRDDHASGSRVRSRKNTG